MKYKEMEEKKLRQNTVNNHATSGKPCEMAYAYNQ